MEHPENNEAYKGLVVNAGIEQPSSVNPYLKRKVKKRQLSVSEFVEGIVKGDVTILSQAVTLVESVRPEHRSPLTSHTCLTEPKIVFHWHPHSLSHS